MNAVAMPENSRAVAGHNQPPQEALEIGRKAYTHLSEWLAEKPVIATEEDARAAKPVVDYVKGALESMESERDGLVRPLNEQVAATNADYKAVRDPLKRLFDVLKDRINTFIEAERVRREAEAAELARIAKEKEEAARAAEAAEHEAIENAKEGEFTDVGAATAQADEAFADFQGAARAAVRADKAASSVKIGGGFGRSLSQRTSETLVIADPLKALAEIMAERDGVLPDKIGDAMRAAARDFRKAKGRLPDGVTSNKTRSL